MKINYKQRKLIEEELKAGAEIVSIAQTVGCSRDALYAEFRRCGMTRDNYDAEQAHKMSMERRKSCDTN